MAFNKMMLVPDPGLVKATNIRTEINNVLRESDSDDVKAKKFRALMMDYLHYFRTMGRQGSLSDGCSGIQQVRSDIVRRLEVVLT